MSSITDLPTPNGQVSDSDWYGDEDLNLAAENLKLLLEKIDLEAELNSKKLELEDKNEQLAAMENELMMWRNGHYVLQEEPHEFERMISDAPEDPWGPQGLVAEQGQKMGFALQGQGVGFAHQGQKVGFAHQGQEMGSAHQGQEMGFAHQGQEVGFAHQGQEMGSAHQGQEMGFAHQGQEVGFAHSQEMDVVTHQRKKRRPAHQAAPPAHQEQETVLALQELELHELLEIDKEADVGPLLVEQEEPPRVFNSFADAVELYERVFPQKFFANLDLAQNLFNPKVEKVPQHVILPRNQFSFYQSQNKIFKGPNWSLLTDMAQKRWCNIYKAVRNRQEAEAEHGLIRVVANRSRSGE